MHKSTGSYDYIIIGAGSAGCVLANRLSADPAISVLLIEAGGADRNPFIHMPAGLPKLVKAQYMNWDYYTEPQPNLNGRRLWWPRGKVLGGCSAINAMCYTRGQPQDYDDWETLGAAGWNWQDILPYFRKAENNERGADDFHGVGGPLNVADLRYHNVLSDAFIEAASAAGHRVNEDFNGPAQEGAGLYQVTQINGQRCSAATAYLKPARTRANLHIVTGAMATRIETRAGRAIAAHYRRGRSEHRVEANREILVSGGAVNSPQLLLLSGIGPAEQLQRFDIPVALNLPGVGRNLQDHLDICTLFEVTQSVTYDMGPLREALVAMQYLFDRNSLGSTNAAEAGAFLRSSRAPENRPDIQLHFVPALLDDHGRNKLKGRGMTIHACNLRPESRGWLELRSSDPADKPMLQPNYLSEAADMDVLLDALRISQEIFSAQPFAQWRGKTIYPESGTTSSEDLRKFIRRKAETIYHPVGTCRMGNGEDAVVDSDLRVHGMEGLRVIDASVMPTLVSGNTNAPVIMIAEKAADMILNGS